MENRRLFPRIALVSSVPPRNGGVDDFCGPIIGSLVLEQELRAFLDALGSQNPKALSWLRPGTDDFSAFDEIDTIALPDDLRQLWSIFDGMSVPEGTLMQYTCLDGTFSYLSVEEAAEDFEVSVDLWEKDQEFENYWPKGFVPIGTPGDGSRLLVNCLAGSSTFGSVYELLHGIGVSRMAVSLSQYFKTLNAFLASGALSVANDGEVLVDFDSCQKIGRHMNPGCNHYD